MQRLGWRISLVVCAAMLTTANGQAFRIGIEGGLSRDDRTISEEWKDGYNVGLSLQFAATDNIQFGIRGAFNRWEVSPDTFLAQLPPGVTGAEVDGNNTIWEIVPFVRIATVIAGSQIGLFGHFGSGLYISDPNVTVEGTQAGLPVTSQFDGDTENNWGLSLGLGVSLGRIAGVGIEFLPLYHVVNPGNNARQYFTVNGGISYEF